MWKANFASHYLSPTPHRFVWSILRRPDENPIGLFLMFIEGSCVEIHYGFKVQDMRPLADCSAEPPSLDAARSAMDQTKAFVAEIHAKFTRTYSSRMSAANDLAVSIVVKTGDPFGRNGLDEVHGLLPRLRRINRLQLQFPAKRQR